MTMFPEDPSYLHMAGQILSVPIKKTHTATVTYPSLDAVKAILAGPDLTVRFMKTVKGISPECLDLKKVNRDNILAFGVAMVQ